MDQDFPDIKTGNGIDRDLAATTNDRLKKTVLELRSLKDAIASFIPFMGAKTVSISGTIDPITKTREYRQLIRDSKIIIYEE